RESARRVLYSPRVFRVSRLARRASPAKKSERAIRSPARASRVRRLGESVLDHRALVLGRGHRRHRRLRRLVAGIGEARAWAFERALEHLLDPAHRMDVE